MCREGWTCTPASQRPRRSFCCKKCALLFWIRVLCFALRITYALRILLCALWLCFILSALLLSAFHFPTSCFLRVFVDSLWLFCPWLPPIGVLPKHRDQDAEYKEKGPRCRPQLFTLGVLKKSTDRRLPARWEEGVSETGGTLLRFPCEKGILLFGDHIGGSPIFVNPQVWEGRKGGEGMGRGSCFSVCLGVLHRRASSYEACFWAIWPHAFPGFDASLAVAHAVVRCWPLPSPSCLDSFQHLRYPKV